MEGKVLSFEQEKKKQDDKKAQVAAYHSKIEDKCYDLFMWYQTEEGGKYSTEEAYLKAAKAMDDSDEYLRLNEGVDGRDMQVRKSLPVSFLEKHTNWKYLDKQGKSKVLWNLGFNTRNFAYKETNRRVYKGSKMCEDLVVEGFERMDHEWLNKRYDDFSHYASDQVRDLVFGKRYF